MNRSVSSNRNVTPTAATAWRAPHSMWKGPARIPWRATRALAWKELHELRWFWYAGMGMMVVLPLIGELYGMFGLPGSSRLLVSVSAGLGATFAVLTAVAATCRDLGGGVETFWRSRPISASTYAGVKFLAGLAVVLSVALAAIAFQHLLTLAMAVSPQVRVDWLEPVNTLLVQGGVMTAMYAVAFAIGAATGQAVASVFLALLAGLVIYFVPVLLPPLATLNVLENLRPQRPVAAADLAWLVGSLLTLAAVAGAAALLVLQRQVRVAVDVKMLGWTLATLLLVMMGVAAAQIGSNLTPTTVVPLTAEGERIAVTIHSGERYGVAVSAVVHLPEQDSGDVPYRHLQRELAYSPEHDHRIHALDLEDEPATIRSIDVPQLRIGAPSLIWHASEPELVTIRTWRGLATYDLRRTGEDAVIREVAAAELLEVTGNVWVWRTWQVGDRLFVPFAASAARDDRNRDVQYLREFEIAPAHELTLLREHEWPGRRTRGAGRTDSPDAATGTLHLLHVPGWSMEQRLRLSLQQRGDARAWFLDERHLVRYSHGNGVEVLRLSPSSPPRERAQARPTVELVPFERIGHRPPTPLERITGGSPVDVLVHEGLLCVLVTEPQSSMIVFDLRDPERPRKLGHYAAPGDLLVRVTATADGRIIAAGRKLHVFEGVGR